MIFWQEGRIVLGGICISLFVNLLLFCPWVQGGSDSWTPLGPYGGELVDLAVDPLDADVVWAVSKDAGVFKTTDGGENWVRLAGGLPDLSDPYDLFAGNAILAFDSTTLLLGGGFGTDTVYASTDGGVTWAVTGTGLPYDPHRFAHAATGSPRPVYAATAHGIYVSNDNGANWVEDDNSLFNFNMVSVAVDPADEDIVWAGNSEGTMWRRDTGGSWTNDVDSPSGARALLMPDSDHVYAGMTTGAELGNSAGDWTWTDMNLDGAGGLEPLGGGDIHPTDSTAALVGSNQGIYATTDTGSTWASVYQDSFARGLATVSYAPNAANRAYASCGLVDYTGSFFAPGVLRLDYSTTWSGEWKNAGIDALGVKSLAQQAANADMLAVGTRHGVFVSTDGGASWSERNSGLGEADIEEVVLHPTDPQVMYAYGGLFGIYESTDGGVNWNGETNLDPVNEMIMDPHSPPDLYLATTSNVSRYDPVTPTLTHFDVLGNGSDVNVRAIAVDASIAARLFAGVHGHGIYLSVDGGMSWQKAGSNDIYPTALAIAPQDSNLVYAAEPDGGGGIIFWRSIDGGDTWARMHSAADWGDVTAIAVDSVDKNAVYAATDNSGVWVSGDGGRSWQQAPGSFPGYKVSDIIADRTTTQKIYIGAANGGVYENTLSTLPEAVSSKKWLLFMSAILSGATQTGGP